MYEKSKQKGTHVLNSTFIKVQHHTLQYLPAKESRPYIFEESTYPRPHIFTNLQIGRHPSYIILKWFFFFEVSIFADVFRVTTVRTDISLELHSSPQRPAFSEGTG